MIVFASFSREKNDKAVYVYIRCFIDKCKDLVFKYIFSKKLHLTC